jgi:hypothetical protein
MLERMTTPTFLPPAELDWGLLTSLLIHATPRHATGVISTSSVDDGTLFRRIENIPYDQPASLKATCFHGGDLDRRLDHDHGRSVGLEARMLTNHDLRAAADGTLR